MKYYKAKIEFNLPTVGQVFTSGNTPEEAMDKVMEFYQHLNDVEITAMMEMGAGELTEHLEEAYEEMVNRSHTIVPGSDFPTFH